MASRGEGGFYLVVVASAYLSIVLVLLTGSNLGLGVVGLVTLMPAVIFAGYLAQRERHQVDQGDYLIDYRLSLRASSIMFGALLGEARDVLRG